MAVDLEPTKVVIGGISYDIQEASPDDLLILKIKAMQAKTATDGQIDRAEERIESGEEISQAWLRRAKRASKYFGWAYQAICLEQCRRTGEKPEKYEARMEALSGAIAKYREYKNPDRYQGMFVQVAQEFLPDDLFEKIHREVLERVIAEVQQESA